MNEESVEKYLSLAGVIIIIVGAILFGLFLLDGADPWYDECQKGFVRFFNPYNYYFFFPSIFLIGVGVVIVYFAKFHKK